MEQKRSFLERQAPWLAALALVLMGVLAGGAALRESMTVDEPTHLAAGVSYLQKLDMRMNVEHPPFAKVLAGLPLVLRGVAVDYQAYSWTFAAGNPLRAYLAQWPFGHWTVTRWNDEATTLAWARFPMLLLTLGLGTLLYVYGSRLGGRTGGLLCACVFACTPAFLAFGPLVVTDIALTFFAVLATWTFATVWESGGRGWSIPLFSLALAGALLSKFSSGVLLFAFMGFQMSMRWLPPAGGPTGREDARVWRRRGWRSTAKGVLGAALVVYAVYFVLTLGQPTTTLGFLGDGPTSLAVRRVLMPAWTFVMGLLFFASMSARPTFILGQAYAHSVWFYFPVLFLLKTPLASLGLFLLAIPVAATARRRLSPEKTLVSEGRQLHWRALWVCLLVFTASCILSPMGISIRHLSLPIALLILLLAPLPRALAGLGGRTARPLGWLSAALVVASLATVARAYPHYIPFLSALGMGREGFTLMNDSNLDWSQDFPEVRRFVEERRLESVLVDPNGFGDPTVSIPQARFWNCQEPAPTDGGQWAVVSAAMILDGHNCSWLLPYRRASLAGGSMHAFALPEAIPPVGAPGGPPRREALRNWGGMPDDMRGMLYQCVRDPQLMKPMAERLEREFLEQWEKRRQRDRQR